MVFRSGEFVSKHIESMEGSLPEEAVQPNGVDLSIDKILKISGTPRIGNEEYYKGEREEVSLSSDDDGNYYSISHRNAYVVVYGEKISIPEDHIGVVLPRSRVMRCGGTIVSALWDSGYEGRGEGGLDVSHPVKIDEEARIAQMVFAKSENIDGVYKGSHQAERL